MSPPVRSYGADDRLQCPRCLGAMGLSRRTPDAERDKKYELQTFTCIKCDYAQTRIADKDGAAPPDTRPEATPTKAPEA